MEEPARVDILLVDDNEKNLLSLEAILGDLGANLVKASSGDEALLRLLQQDFALILLDIQMPNLDGFETARLIRQRDRTRHTPIIFLTAFNRSAEQAVKGYALGAVDFLFKPIGPEVLRSKVSVFIELHRKSLEIQRQAARLREAEQREHQRAVADARQRWEKELLREEMENERRLAEAHAQRADELSRIIAEREQAQGALRESNERLQLLSETANMLLAESETGHAVDELFRRLSSRLGLDMIALHRLEPDGQALRLTGSVGMEGQALQTAQVVPLGMFLTGRAGLERKPVVVEGVETSTARELELVRSIRASAYCCYPLMAGGQLLGTLGFGTRQRPRFAAGELATLQAVSDQFALALERERLVQELRQLAQDLQDRDRRKDEFLAMLGHELRNPLAPILNAVQVLQLRAPTEEPLVQRALAAADRQIRHMTRLVDDLLDVSRITTGKIELRRERLDLSSIVEHAAQTCESLLRDRRHRLEVSLSGEALPIDGDPTRLGQVVSNLLNNAAKYTDPGGHIVVRLGREGSDAVLTVRDDGVGIAPEMLGKVFDLFVQADRAADRSLGGLGIGLTLVDRLVAMHGGRVSARSEGLGKGSEFEVRLPLAERAEETAGARAAQGKHDRAGINGLRIAVIEDNSDIRSTLRDLLELHGHAVTEAEDGPRGVELVLAERPDVALVDIGLPGVDGYQVAQRVRAAANAATRLVALTGYGTPDDRRRALAAGFDAHLAKPIDLADLSRLLQELC